MVVAHVCDAFLSDRWRGGIVWQSLDVTFGFVAPAFLLLSGAALWLALSRGPTLAVRRLALTLALAYWLQIPLLSLRQLVWNHPPDLIARLFDSNILHVVALSGFALVLLARIDRTPSRRIARTVAIVAALVLIVATPWVWHAEPVVAWTPLRAFVSAPPDSTFPLVPYAAYPLIGFALMPLVATASRSRAGMTVAAGLALVVAGLGADALIQAVPSAEASVHGDFWYGSIQHIAVRLGVVVAALGVAMLVAPALPARTTLLEQIGRRSLAIYVLHLMLVYGSPMTMGARYWLAGRFDRALDPFAVAAIAAVVLAVVVAAALAWPRLRERAPRTARLLWWGWWLAFAVLFPATP